jgi:hypothetical protein
MTTRKRTNAAKGKVKKLKLKKETLRDLDVNVKRNAGNVKGGVVLAEYALTIGCVDAPAGATQMTKCAQVTCATGNVWCVAAK